MGSNRDKPVIIGAPTRSRKPIDGLASRQFSRAEIEQILGNLDHLARGSLPRDRVRPPARGERCPPCHTAWRDKPCLLCNPYAVPAAHGGHAVTNRRDAAIIAARLPAPRRDRPISGELVVRRRTP